MKTILILGAGTEQVNAIDAAKSKGIRTVVLDMNPNAPGATHADEFYAVSTHDAEGISGFLRDYKKKVDGVMTIASDIPQQVSAAAELLNVPHIPIWVAQTCVHKLKMKEVLKASGITVPEFKNIASVKDLADFAKRVGYPIVIKPVDNSGARGVLRLIEGDNLEEALEYARKFSYAGECIAEKFIEGLQISTEGIMYRNTFYCTGFADRNYIINATSRYLVEDGGEIPTTLDTSKKKMVEQEFEKAVRALNIDWGPGKGDMILGADGKVYVIEIAARLSGGNFCYDKVPWATGVDIVDILIDMTVGNEVDVKRFVPTKDLASTQRYFFPPPGIIRKIAGVEEALKLPFVKKIDIWMKEGDVVPPTVNHPSRVGYVITLAPTRSEAVAAAERAIKTVTFTILP